MSVETATIVDRFESSLAELDVPVSHTTPAEFDRAIREAIEEPAVGTQLPFEGFDLPEEVNTSPTPTSLRAATTGVTAAVFGIADYGSVAIRSTPEGAEPVSLFVDKHVAVLRRSDVLADMPTAIDRLGPSLRGGDSVVLATGPSATADMGALVRGAHGPEDVTVVLVDADGHASDAGGDDT